MLKESHVIEKSKSLVWAKLREYKVGELRVLETYLSRINARDSESTCVSFTKKEYTELMGLKADLKTSQLKAYTRGLLRNVVDIELPNGGYKQLSLFAEAKCEVDPELGQTVISIECNPKLKEAFFDLAESGYVTYQLKTILALKSAHSIRLYPILKDRPFGFTIELAKLRDILGANRSTYEDFKYFNHHVLKKAVKEINETTDIYVETEQIKNGQTVERIKFNVFQKTKAKPEEVQLALEDFEAIEDHADENDILNMFAEALPEWVTKAQVEELYGLAAPHVPYEVMNFHEKNIWIYDYMRKKTLMLRAEPGVEKPYAWLKKAIKENWE